MKLHIPSSFLTHVPWHRRTINTRTMITVCGNAGTKTKRSDVCGQSWPPATITADDHQGMPVMLENLLTLAKLFNERLGTAVDMVVDCNSEGFDLDDQYVQYTSVNCGKTRSIYPIKYILSWWTIRSVYQRQLRKNQIHIPYQIYTLEVRLRFTC